MWSFGLRERSDRWCGGCLIDCGGRGDFDCLCGMGAQQRGRGANWSGDFVYELDEDRRVGSAQIFVCVVEIARAFFQRVEEQFLRAAAVLCVAAGKLRDDLDPLLGDRNFVEPHVAQRRADRHAWAGTGGGADRWSWV